ncbi:glycosyltransferase family 2 protein [Veillonella intestinalis]|uniref:glycosyltransferase family 2 protein n=1 Tax=Veillonella intestinalis TaxID=2941341 RepID=UPI0020409379|nr:glycosyltransferase family 2 protein [Veillonella intestinalis]
MSKVSIIMGVYNSKNKRSLCRSIESIQAQTFTDWEFIICDDASTDDSYEIIEKFSSNDNRIKIIKNNVNLGLAGALNRAIKIAQGMYIARMDDDDIAHPERLERQIEFLDKNLQYSFVGSCANVYNEEGIWGYLHMPERPTVQDFLWNIPFIHPSMVFRKNVFENFGGYVTDKINRRCEDYTLVMDLYSKGLLGYNIQVPLLDYYVENGSKKYRPMKDRISEAVVRWHGYKKNHILLKGLPYVAKPIILGLIPQFIFKNIKKQQYKRG